MVEAKKGGLNTRETVAAQVKLRFEEPPKRLGNSRIMEFFREFFHYSYALEVFKDKPARGYYLPRLLVQDLAHLIQFILEKDRQVLRELLTTDHYFVDIEYDQDVVAFQPSYFQPSNGNNPFGPSPSTPRCMGFPAIGSGQTNNRSRYLLARGRYIDPSGMVGSLEPTLTVIRPTR